MNANGLSFKMRSSPSKPRSYHLKWLELVFSRGSQSRAHISPRKGDIIKLLKYIGARLFLCKVTFFLLKMKFAFLRHYMYSKILI